MANQACSGFGSGGEDPGTDGLARGGRRREGERQGPVLPGPQVPAERARTCARHQKVLGAGRASVVSGSQRWKARSFLGLFAHVCFAACLLCARLRSRDKRCVRTAEMSCAGLFSLLCLSFLGRKTRFPTVAESRDVLGE